MGKVMNSINFVNIAKDIATKYKTLYIMGCFGSPMNSTNKNRYCNNNSYNKQSARTNKIMSASSDTFGFDCVCLIKGILWGWNGDVNKTYGGAVYNSNGVPDKGADQIMNYCSDVSSDFKNIIPGELVHMSGHVGIYIGDGLAVECTPIWKDGVQITAVGNIGKKSGYNTRTWQNHGKLNFIDYVKSENSNPPQTEVDNTNGYTGKFKIGDKVVINGNLYVSSKAVNPSGKVNNKITTITRVAENTAHPYNTTGDLGWINESDIKLYEEPQSDPKPEVNPDNSLKVGDKVKIIGKGNGSSFGTSNTAYGIGWEREILKIWDGRKFPYQVGNSTGTTGFYQESSLQKI